MVVYRKNHYSPENLSIIITKLKISGLGAVNATRKLDHNYMEFVGYKTCDKLLWISGIVDRTLPRHPCGVRSGPLGPTPPPGTPAHGSEERWILRAPFQGPVRRDPGGPTLPHGSQCDGRRGPPSLGLRGGRNGGDSRT